MKEFQVENNLTAMINATADHINPALTISDQSEKSSDNTEEIHSHLNQTKTKLSNSDRSRLNVKTNRFTSDTFRVRLYFH